MNIYIYIYLYIYIYIYIYMWILKVWGQNRGESNGKTNRNEMEIIVT